MKNIKNAFSLFELLIVLAIISVLTVMLMSISKQGLENAYNRYYYASYKAMADAISYSNNRIYTTDEDSQTTSNNLNYYYIGYALGFKKDDAGNSLSNYQTPTIGEIKYPKTNNGVQYSIKYNNPNYTITASLPSTSGDFNATFIYIPDANGGILIPYQAQNLKDASNPIKLYERKDLLPFYVDNGINGRSYKAINKDDNNYTLVNREHNYDNSKNIGDTIRHYDSFIKTYCSLSTKKYNDENNTFSQEDDAYASGSQDKVLKALGMTSCSNANAKLKGFIKVANPNKVL